MIVVEIDLPDKDDSTVIQRLKLSHLEELWKMLPDDPEDYDLEQIVPGRFWRVNYKRQHNDTEVPQIQGHWFPFD